MRTGWGVGLALCAALLGFSLRAQEEAKGPRILSASVETQGERCRVILSGEAEGPDGTLLVLRALPRIYQLGGDGRSLVPSVSEVGSVACRAELRGGAFRASLAPARLLEQEIRIEAPGIGGGAAVARMVVFFDVAWVNRQICRDVQAFGRYRKEIAEFLARLEPYERSASEVPAKLARSLERIDDEVACWAEGALPAAAASVLRGILNEMWMSVPWAALPGSARRSGEAPASPATGGYEPFRPARTAKIETAKWAALLERASEVALREAMVAVLVCLEEWTVRLGRQDARRLAAARGELHTLRSLVVGLRSGDLAGAGAAYAPAADLEALLASVTEAAEWAPGGGVDDSALERIRERAAPGKAIRLKVLAPPE